MIRASFVVALATPTILLAACVCRAQEPAKQLKQVDQPASLRKAIKEANDLLDAKKTDEFLEQFFAPGLKEMIKESGQWDAFKKQADDRYLKDLSGPLKEIQSQQVELSADKRDAVFTLPAPIPGFGRTLGFEKLGDQWVLYNRALDLKTGEKRIAQPEGLRRSVKRCVGALEANKWDDVVKMIAPDERERAEKGGAPPKEMVASVLKVLKEVQSSSRKVILSADGDKATFELSAESPKHTISFKKSDGTWYLSIKD